MKQTILGLTLLLLTSCLHAATPELAPLGTDTVKVKKTKVTEPKKKEAKPEKKEAAKTEKKKEAKPDKKAEAKPAGKVESTTTTTTRSSGGSVSASKFQKPYKTWALTLNGSFTNPYTDLKYRRFLGVSKPKNEYQWGVGVGAIHMFDGAFGIMGQFNAGALQGVADSNMDSKFDYKAMVASGIDPSGNYFKGMFYEASANLYWDITNTVFGINRMLRARNSGKEYKPRWVSLYSYAGIGINYSSVKVYHLKTGLLDNSGTFFNGSTTSLVVPVGLGVKFKLSKLIDLGLESSWHFTFTDKLDGLEYEHHNNKRRDDFYSMIGATLTFKLGTKKRDKEHIEWRHPQEGIYADLERIEKRVDKLYKDSDGDGVSDVFDKDNETPEGQKVYGDGTGVDSDRDGIPDEKDVEPFSDPGAKVDENGKAVDTDDDGVPDSRDLEPNTPKGNLVDARGRSINDKFADKNADMGNGRGGFFFPSVYFEFNKDDIQRQYEPELQAIAKTLRENQGLTLKVIGYCDQRGTVPYNDDLGMRRAKQVIDYMVRVYGFQPAQFEAVSVGNRVTEKAEHWINRRVDFVAKK
ncbi:MAG: OmpA family protein [Bacteroidetes bacterium]|nr:OmpA family protein [Bacteroidota bacterium]